jgi:hypothetical protein
VGLTPTLSDHFYGTALPCIRFFESTAKLPNNSAMLRQFFARAVVFSPRLGGGFFRHSTTRLGIPLSEAIARTTSSATKRLWPQPRASSGRVGLVRKAMAQ